MDVQPYRSDAQRALEKGCIKELTFSGSTYQLEIKLPNEKESYWPFLHLKDNGDVQDAFCSCDSEAYSGCLHLAIAYLKIFNETEKPLHLRFEHSFWNILCSLSAHHTGYEEWFLKKDREEKYYFDNDLFFSIQATSESAKKQLKNWIENRPRETPENSIKFSNISQEEITWWKEGRPSPEVRYMLSLWSDLAKWLLIHQHEGRVDFKEDSEGFPTEIKAQFPDFTIRWKITYLDLEKLIPFFTLPNMDLKLYFTSKEKIESMKYDEQTQSINIEYETVKATVCEKRGKQIGEWIYHSKKGFSKRDGPQLGSCIKKEHLPAFLENFADQIHPFIQVAKERSRLRYEMSFDTKSRWHFSAYLFEKGDLQQPGAALIDNWVYLPQKGFYKVEDVLFKEKQKVLLPEDVSKFVNHHRIWLNSQVGFQTHLARIESHLSFSVNREGTLCFHTKKQSESVDYYDFGDWVYYVDQGFFSKQRSRVERVVHSGLKISKQFVSQFIKKNRDELENIPRFFGTDLLVNERGLKVVVKSLTSILVKPIYKGKAGILFFQDFVYDRDQGFCELPSKMRLPDYYEESRTIHRGELNFFIEEELPKIEKYIIDLDPRLKPPIRSDLQIQYLVRMTGGELKAKLVFQTEHGAIPLSLIAQGHEKKRRYLFSNGGLIDLHDAYYQWVSNLTHRVNPDIDTVQLTMLEFMRLETTFSLLGPKESDPTAEITRRVLRELRDFSAHETANIKGLKSELRLYQKTGLQWLWFLYRNGLSALLCDDMGLGKTHQAMGLIAATLNEKPEIKKRFLVVCPTSVIYHWQDKLTRFLPSIKVHTFHGVKRSLKQLPKEGLILTTYGILRVEKKSIEKIPFEIVIYDEIQVAKNPSSRINQALGVIQSRMRVGLTGTPIENNLIELKALFDIVLPGYMPTDRKYRENFVNPIERHQDIEKKQLLSQMIRPFVLRRKKSEVLQELPEKIEDKSYCKLSIEQQQIYQDMLIARRDQLVTQLRDQESSINYIHVFALLSHLKQVCNHPALVKKDPKNYKKYESGKWNLFVELLHEARESEQKVVVFSQYLYMLDIIELYLKEQKWGYAQIRGDTLNRADELKRFQEDTECVVFIGSLQAAGLGIDLTAASVVIMYDRWWNAARENQAIDRVHRIGQKWGVQVYKLITIGTIEEKIDLMITQKGALLEEIVTSDDQAIFKKFSRKELMDLLSFSS